MTEPDEVQLSLFCRKHGDFWTVMIGAGWLSPRLRPFLNEHFETDALLLDFDYLQQSFQRKSLNYERKDTKAGDIVISARGVAARALAGWLGSAMASGLSVRPSAPSW